MSYFAVAVSRGPKGWSAAELDLGRPSHVEDVAEQLRDHDTEAEVSLLFVEADDEYFTVLRLDQGEDLRVFGSDAGFADESWLGAVLLGDLDLPGPLELGDDDYEAESSDDEEDDDEAAEPSNPDVEEPVGDADLLSDLGISDRELLELCSREGMLPSDVTAEICTVLSCADDVEELR